MNYKIFSNIECIAKIKDNFYELDETNYLEVEENIPVYLYPIVKGYLPILLKPNDENIKKVRHEDSIFIFPEFPVISSGEMSLFKNFGNKVAKLNGKPYKFTISSENKSYSFTINKEIKFPEITNISGIPAVSAEVGDKSFLLIFNDPNFIELEGDIEIKNSKIKALCSLKNSIDHGELWDIEIALGKISIKKDLVYLSKKPKVPKFTPAINFTFLEAIKAKDYNLAKSLLSNNLQEKLDTEHLEKFFGTFDKIIPLSLDAFCVINKNTSRVFKFKNENKKIVDVN